MLLAAEVIEPGLKPPWVWQNEPDVRFSLAERTQAPRRVVRFGRTNPSMPTCGSVWPVILAERTRAPHAILAKRTQLDHADGRCMVARFGRTNPSMPTSGSAWQNEPKRVMAVGAIHCRGLRMGNIVI
jgi:hypothetical protein